MLITNDGELTHRLLSPAYHVKKTYFVQVDQKIPDTTAGQFAEGVDIGDEKRTLPADLKILGDREAELTISEGRFHQVKRMFASVGCKVTYLKRISMGTLTLGTLEKATYRKLTEQELASLKKEAEINNHQEYKIMYEGYLPISKQDMQERGIKQLDFVYVCGDAYVDHPSLVMQSLPDCWRHMAIRWESLRSRTGRMMLLFPCLAFQDLAFWFLPEIWILW